ncbi:hypothetical protein D9619_008409 [Psilocybe cf. subviscida]|uniref:Uncharacterized protein n=1 Tax=Psilocybe cf. subviscida TaxID=2480587 RepID=A0A8H5BA01_9AGAR|nr:hypothetical protein D9619_008409 [Psilocybe cf. subviscida]
MSLRDLQPARGQGGMECYALEGLFRTHGASVFVVPLGLELNVATRAVMARDSGGDGRHSDPAKHAAAYTLLESFIHAFRSPIFSWHPTTAATRLYLAASNLQVLNTARVSWPTTASSITSFDLRYTACCIRPKLEGGSSSAQALRAAQLTPSSRALEYDYLLQQCASAGLIHPGKVDPCEPHRIRHLAPQRSSHFIEHRWSSRCHGDHEQCRARHGRLSPSTSALPQPYRDEYRAAMQLSWPDEYKAPSSQLVPLGHSQTTHACRRHPPEHTLLKPQPFETMNNFH